MRKATLPNGKQIFASREFEAYAVLGQIPAYFRHGICVKEGDVVFDVGANIGLFTLTVCDWGARPVTVFAFEPLPREFKALRANVEKYGLSGVVPLPYAVSQERGELSLTYYPRMTVFSTIYPRDVHSPSIEEGFWQMRDRFPTWVRWIMRRLPERHQRLFFRFVVREMLRGKQLKCRCVSISDVMREYDIKRIDLLKIDVELAELDVLRGIAFEDWKRIEQVTLEVHDVDGRLDTVMQMLRERGLDSVVCEQDQREFNTFNVYAVRQSQSTSSDEPASGLPGRSMGPVAPEKSVRPSGTGVFLSWQRMSPG